MRQKKYISKIILAFLSISLFFVFAVSVSSAANNISIGSLFDGLLALTKNATIGYLDTSAGNKVKVCKDVTCTDPEPGIINFEISDDESPFTIDKENGLSGKVWGDELGWVIFNPPYGGVFFADQTTGLLKGTAWSENSGAINFGVTGQKVIIDPVTGEWSGWAWAAGPYGGWIKFDCKNDSCVRTKWSEKTLEVNAGPVSETTELSSPKPALGEKSFVFLNSISTKFKVIVIDVLENFYFSFVNLYKQTIDIVNSLVSYSTSFRSSLLAQMSNLF